ncbi:hypothetical protein ACFYKT_19125 [Cytobacillus sp. FJAT-53684]|uniref:Zinc-ribbon domain-containing protein n=1 Tax=Cytobacillus mangrovibacter TaxID=3299024 RepID=A0ABW6K6C2_9BACI
MGRKRGWKKSLYTIQNLKDFAKDRGGKCLSKEYTKMKDQYEWLCLCGYVWEASFNNIVNGTWCPKCSGRLKKTINEMHEFAEKKGGKCLSDIYINNKIPLLWECEKGHQFSSTFDSVSNNNTWCNHRECTSAPRYNLSRIQEIASERGGKCLSSNYTNYNTPMKWECEHGHIWETPAKYILKGHWCHVCNIKPLRDLNYLSEIAESRNGKLLSREYQGMQMEYEWECEKGHQWFAPAGAVASGRWCHECRKGNIEEFQELALYKGGHCISIAYKDRVTPLEFQCKEGHQFFGTPSTVKNSGAWCPYCLTSKGEERSRLILEKLLQVSFKKTRKILGDHLELDGYNAEKMIAFEFHGEQHYHFNKYFHGDEDGFLYQILTDLEKKYRCKLQNIHLIIIPYFEEENLVDYVKDKLVCLNISFNNDVVIDFNDIYKNKSRVQEYEEIAQRKKGKLLSTNYVDSYTKLLFECENGHQFEHLPYTVKNEVRWCKECNREIHRKNQLSRLNEIVESRNGKLHSPRYNNSTTHLKFECREKHIWTTSPAVIFKGHWCPKCSQKKRRIS